MEHSHMAAGTHHYRFVRVDVHWTPGIAGIEVHVRDGDSLVYMGQWEAPGYLITECSPDDNTLNQAVCSVISPARLSSWHADYAYRMASRDRFTWLPGKYA